MRRMPLSLRKQLSEDPAMKKCVKCPSTEVTWHHPFIYARKQVNERWSICPLCWYHHLGKGWTYEVRKFCERWCLKRATEEELAEYPKQTWTQSNVIIK